MITTLRMRAKVNPALKKDEGRLATPPPIIVDKSANPARKKDNPSCGY